MKLQNLSTRWALILAILCLPVAASAQPKHWYQDKKWWVGEAIIGAAIAADYGVSAHQGFVGESNVLLGPHPSTGRAVGVSLFAFGFESGVHILNWHLVVHNEPNKYWRAAGYLTMPAISAGAHGYAAIHDASLSDHLR
jgi:hypothetical protein